MSVAAIVVAAGRGLRAGGEVPKQYRAFAGRSVLARTLEALLAHPRIAVVQPVTHASDQEVYRAVLDEVPDVLKRKLNQPVEGGDTRQQSVRNGLEALARADADVPSTVLVHDAARPFVDRALIDRAIEAGERHLAAVPGVAVTDTVKVVDEANVVTGTPARERLRAIQTPQAFAFDRLLDAHRTAAAAGLAGFTDDGAIAEWAGLRVSVFEGDPGNTKLTRAADFEAAERLAGGSMTLVTRLGTGFDVHAFAEGDHVWLGGVRIGHTQGVSAHSDGDVVLHALTDAILGALADGDIGVHFPPSDPQWRGASSDRFLAFAADRVRARGGVIDHLDVTLLCEAPRLGPHRDAIRQTIAEIAGVALGSVSIKATTTEKLGFTGRREGIAAQAAATVRVPQQEGA